MTKSVTLSLKISEILCLFVTWAHSIIKTSAKFIYYRSRCLSTKYTPMSLLFELKPNLIVYVIVLHNPPKNGDVKQTKFLVYSTVVCTCKFFIGQPRLSLVLTWLHSVTVRLWSTCRLDVRILRTLKSRYHPSLDVL